MFRLSLPIFLFFSMTLFSCATINKSSKGESPIPGKVFFTNKIIQGNSLTEEDLKNIQYYLSDDLLLSREVLSGEYNVTKGKLITKSGITLEEVIIKRGTPGIAIEIYDDKRMSISFEEGTSLMFGNSDNDKMDRFILFGKSKRDEKTGKQLYFIPFADNEYTPKLGSTVSLLIDRESISDVMEERRELKGIRLGD